MTILGASVIAQFISWGCISWIGVMLVLTALDGTDKEKTNTTIGETIKILLLALIVVALTAK